MALLYRVKKYPVLEFSFSYEKGVGFKIFLQGLDPVGFFYLTGLKSSIGLLDILVFQLLVLVTAFWILVLFGFSWLAFLSVSPDIGNSGFCHHRFLQHRLWILVLVFTRILKRTWLYWIFGFSFSDCLFLNC